MAADPPDCLPSTSDVAHLGVWLVSQPFHEVLQAAVEIAAASVVGVDAASLTVPTGRRLETTNASSTIARAVDDSQYEAGRGPCLEAYDTGHEVSADVPVERWPEFSRAATRAGFAKVWSFPLQVATETNGALNLYTMDPNAVTLSAEAARVLSGHTAVVIARARAFAQSQGQNTQLRQALRSRTVIGQAQGVVMAHEDVDPDAAFDILRRASQQASRTLHDIASEIVSSFSGHESDAT